MTSGFLFTTWSMKPGSWWEKTCCDPGATRARSVGSSADAMGTRQPMSRVVLSHFACWLNIESMMWMNAS